MGPSGMVSQVRRELANVTARSFSSIFEMSCWLGVFCKDWKKENYTPILKNIEEIPGGPQTDQPHLSPEEIDGEKIPVKPFQIYEGQQCDL